MQTLRVYNSRILKNKNAKFSGYYFCMNKNIKGHFQICISVPLMQTLNVNDFYQVRVNSWNLGFTQTWENNPKSPWVKEKCDSFVLRRSDPWMIWRCHGISRFYCLYFYLESTVRKDTWMRTASVTVMVTFFESGILQVTWSQLCSKSFLNKYEAHWQ